MIPYRWPVLSLLACALAVPLRAQSPASTFSLSSSVTPEQTELNKITAENAIADQKTRKRLQALNDEKEDLRVQYDLLTQKQKLKNSELEAQLERLNNENRLSAEQHRRDLDALQAELERLAAENQRNREKLAADTAALETEYEKLAVQDKLADERVRAETTKSTGELQKLRVENSLSAERNKTALLAVSEQVEKLRLANDLKNEEERALNLADEKERRGIDLALKRLDLEERKIKLEAMAMDSRMARLKSDLELRDKRWEWKKESNSEPVYLAQPFANGRLVVSDRRIALDGPIVTGAADYVTERIHYYNNISSQPVFVVINICPGGSVMEGYRIIKTMQESRAPIYVVVKSFAASMAAVVTAMAERSYVYPNAIILHHQMAGMSWGNVTQLKEQLELARDWERRMYAPVAKKMGLSLEDLRKKMYEKNSDGDWQEFGDKAVSYGWATSLVNEIAETGFVKDPEQETKPPKPSFWLGEKTDEKGQRYVALPRLNPFDFYFIYNPDRYYR